MRSRIIEALDTLCHKLHINIGWLCDLYDLSLGITKAELRRSKESLWMTVGGTSTTWTRST